MTLDAAEQIEKFQEFMETHYNKELNNAISKGECSVIIDFFDLSKFDPSLAEQLLEEPIDTVKAAELAVQQLDTDASLRARFRNLPESQMVKIRNLRSVHLGKFIALEGIIRQASNVRPEVVAAKFECPSCASTITLQQTESKFREPSRCSCGRKGKFRLLAKELVDAQRLVVEEAPQSLEGGAEPKRIPFFLREDLVDPKFEKRTTPGKHVRVTGIMREIPIPSKEGGIKTTFELVINSNHLELVEADYSDIEINEDDEKEIKELAKSRDVYQKLVASIAPSIFGHDTIKEALMLQMLGGIKKIKKDGTAIRGDMHILLVGDPGAGKSNLLTFVKITAPKARYVAGKGASSAGLCVAPNSLVLTNPGGMNKIKDIVEKQLQNNKKPYCDGVWHANKTNSDVKVHTLNNNFKLEGKKPAQFWKLKAPKEMVQIKTRSGKELSITKNTKLLTIGEQGVNWRKSAKFQKNDFIATARRMKEAKGKIFIPNLIKSDPILYGIKKDIKNILKGVNKRELAKKLGFNETNLYHNWINEKARGNIHLSQLKKICKELNYPLEKVNFYEFSLYKGHRITLPKYIGKDFLYFAGLIAGDGDLSQHNSVYSIRFSNSSDELIQKFKKLVKKLFNVECNYSSRNSEKRPASVRFGSKIVFQILNQLGIPKSPKSDKIDMSNLLLNMPNDDISSFISGLFDSDGSVVIRDKGASYIDLTTTSKNLAQKLHLLLLRFGVLSKLRFRKVKPNHKVNSKLDKYVIEIKGKPNLVNFEKNIDFGYSLKRQRLNKVIDSIKRHKTNTDIVPNINKLIKKAVEANFRHKRELYNVLTERCNISNNRLNKVVEVIEKKGVMDTVSFDKISTLAKSDIFWDQIKEITYEANHGYNYVYDLTVENSHNFLVNGFVVHNTASVVKDEFTRGWALEAGAMVLADRGILVIDEMDKMTKEDTSALHEAMEQQQITIAKANIQATLRAETTVLAAANPKLGRFDPYESIAKQIDLPPALINRFDLIFVVRDIPDKVKDHKIANQVLMNQSYRDMEPAISPELLRKFIAYAKQRVNPLLTNEAMKSILDFYVSLRNSGRDAGDMKSIPISPRQLEALVRLAEASARVRLSNKVKKEDALRAIRLLKTTLLEVGIDPETGQIDIDRIATGITSSERGRYVTIREIIFKMDKDGKKTIPIEEVIKEAAAKGIPETVVEDAIEKFKRSGDIFEPKRGHIQKI